MFQNQREFDDKQTSKKVIKERNYGYSNKVEKSNSSDQPEEALTNFRKSSFHNSTTYAS